MQPETENAAVQADFYIDALLAGHGRVPVPVAADEGFDEPLGHQPGVRDAIRVLEKGLPRFHPSFVFEEWLSGQLKRSTGGTGDEGAERPAAEIMSIVIRPQETGTGQPDRRPVLLVGGAIASGVSIAGAAVIAWRRTRHLAGNAD